MAGVRFKGTPCNPAATNPLESTAEKGEETMQWRKEEKLNKEQMCPLQEQ